MTNETLAGYANLSLYSAMAVYVVAMLCHAAYLAGLLPARDRLRSTSAAPTVVASAGDGRGTTVLDPPTATDHDVPARARKAAGIGATTTWLGGLLLLVSV